MSQTIRMQVISAVVALLSGTGSPATPYRARLEDFTVDQLPAYNVLPGKDEPGEVVQGDIERSFTFRVECKASAANQADLAVEPLYMFAVKQIMADPKLGGLADFVYERASEWTFEHGDQDLVSLNVDFEVEFMTDRTDPSVNRS